MKVKGLRSQHVCAWCPVWSPDGELVDGDAILPAPLVCMFCSAVDSEMSEGVGGGFRGGGGGFVYTGGLGIG